MGNIVWLASYPKSGNTWLRVFLANLLADSVVPIALSDLAKYARIEADPELYSQVAGRPSTQLNFEELCSLRPQVQAALAASASGTVFVKTHSMAGSFEGVPLLAPQATAGAIYIVRNPLDVVISMTYHFSISLDEAIDYLGNERAATENNALFVTEFLGSWSQHVNSWAQTNNHHILVLRYEDLLMKAQEYFGKVAHFIGMGAEHNRISRAIAFSNFTLLADMEARDGFAERPMNGSRFFRAGLANQWRDVLSRDQVERIIANHGAQMVRFRYMPAGL